MGKLVVLLLAAGVVFGQDAGLARLKRELARAREHAKGEKFDFAGIIAPVHSALRDWIESRLPKDRNALAVKYSALESSMRADMAEAGIAEHDSSSTDLDHHDPGFDYAVVAFKWFPELTDELFITASVKIPCGMDDAVYMYSFRADGWTRAIADHSKADWGNGYAQIQISGPDSQGGRLVLIHRTSVQCGSSWMGTAYSIHRVGLLAVPEPLLSEDHDFWLGNDGPEFVLRPTELMIEFLDRSIDLGVHNRTYLLRYSFADGVRRLEPFAFQPQDFVEEWLTRPWSEMQSTSAPQTTDWYSKLRKVSFNEYSKVVACAGRPGRWAIALQVTYDGEKELKQPLESNFLVKDLGNYRYLMEAVSDNAFEGCPGEGAPSDKHPWLSIEQLKALP